MVVYGIRASFCHCLLDCLFDFLSLSLSLYHYFSLSNITIIYLKKKTDETYTVDAIIVFTQQEKINKVKRKTHAKTRIRRTPTQPMVFGVYRIQFLFIYFLISVSIDCTCCLYTICESERSQKFFYRRRVHVLHTFRFVRICDRVGTNDVVDKLKYCHYDVRKFDYSVIYFFVFLSLSFSSLDIVEQT